MTPLLPAMCLVRCSYGEREAFRLLGPSISFLLGHCQQPEDAAAIVAPLDLDQRDLVLLPINNNEDVSQAEGGAPCTHARTPCAQCTVHSASAATS